LPLDRVRRAVPADAQVDYLRSRLPAGGQGQGGTRPGCGAVVAMLEAASGVKAFSVGKPSPVMLRGARKELGLSAEQTVVIGDTMDTDILGGAQLGYHTVLVLSGTTRRDDLVRYADRPHKVVESIADLSHARLVQEFVRGPRPHHANGGRPRPAFAENAP
jgi:NagD protein